MISDIKEINEKTWNREYAARQVERMLGLERGQGTVSRWAVNGQEYIVFAGTGIKEEGAKIEGWRGTPYLAWKTFLETLEERYFNIPEDSKIYWRWKPSLEQYENKWAVDARLVIGYS